MSELLNVETDAARIKLIERIKSFKALLDVETLFDGELDEVDDERSI